MRESLIEHEHSAVEPKYISAYEQRKGNSFDQQQRVVHSGAGNINRRVNIATYLRTSAANAHNVRSSTRERLNSGRTRKATVQRGAQHRECRAAIDQRIGNAHASNLCGCEYLRCSFAARSECVRRKRLTRVSDRLRSAGWTVARHVLDATTGLALARRLCIIRARGGDVAILATLKSRDIALLIRIVGGLWVRANIIYLLLP